MGNYRIETEFVYYFFFSPHENAFWRRLRGYKKKYLCKKDIFGLLSSFIPNRSVPNTWFNCRIYCFRFKLIDSERHWLFSLYISLFLLISLVPWTHKLTQYVLVFCRVYLFQHRVQSYLATCEGEHNSVLKKNAITTNKPPRTSKRRPPLLPPQRKMYNFDKN